MLELALAAKQFGQRPCVMFGIDIERADPGLLIDFDLLCSLRLILWDAYLEEKKAEAMENARHSDGVPDQQPTLVIPEYQN